MQTLQRILPIIGRLLLSPLFISAGFGKIAGFSGTVAYMQAHGMPLAEVLAVGAIIVELGGGILLLVGYKADWAALAIALFLIPTTLIFHQFWAVPEAQAGLQQIMFLKNLAIMGGLASLGVVGSGLASVDCALDRRAS